MRIAMVGHKRVPSREGGIEVVVEELAARMVVHGHAVTCYNRSGHHVSGREYDAEHLDEYRGIRLKHLPTIDRKGLAAVTSSFFGCLAAAFGPYDVVHIHAEGPAMFSWIPRLTGKRVILTIHGLDWARDKWKGSRGPCPRRHHPGKVRPRKGLLHPLSGPDGAGKGLSLSGGRLQKAGH